MSKVIKFPGPIDPDDILENAKGRYDEVVVMGWDKDGLLSLSSNLDTAESVLMIEAAKFEFVRSLFGDD